MARTFGGYDNLVDTNTGVKLASCKHVLLYGTLAGLVVDVVDLPVPSCLSCQALAKLHSLACSPGNRAELCLQIAAEAVGLWARSWGGAAF